jgi:uncharacterized protein YkwD
MQTAPLRAAPWVLALLVAACGGGDDSPSPPVLAAGDITCGLGGFESQTLQFVNARRAAGASCGAEGSFGPAPPLSWDVRLANAGYAHSRDMADHNYFAHTGLDGSSPGTRVTAAGYSWSFVGENIAGGPTSVEAVVDAWMGSPGHCANIMSPGFRHIGMACAFNGSSTYKRYWTMDLASP